MSSKIAKPVMRSAAWRISLWATLAFAFGTMIVFIFLHRFVASDIQRRSDAWLSGEVEVLSDVAERTPKDALYGRVVGEVAELASREAGANSPGSSVFFLQAGNDGALKLWVGSGDGQANLKAILSTPMAQDQPTDVLVRGFSVPFRVASKRTGDGSEVYLGLSERDQLRLLRNLRLRFLVLWMLIVLLGFAIVFFTSRRMLSHVRNITEAASRIGHSDIDSRVPTTQRNDEVSQLAHTLNRMLDRIENSMHQLHTITDSLAHDLRSPLTAIRGKLEMSLSADGETERADAVVSAIDELDRLTDFLNKSLDVAEAKADALRLTRTEIELDGLLNAMVDLYEPSMSDRGLKVRLRYFGPVKVFADSALLHRMIANLLDNELKHVPASCTVTIELRADEQTVSLIVSDNGPGFDSDVLVHLFERRVRGKHSDGHGLGMAFVDAVARAHGGTVSASNLESGGARTVVSLPLATHGQDDLAAPVASSAN